MFKDILNYKLIKKEVTVLHFLLLSTGKLLIGFGVGIPLSHMALPYSFPFIVIGVMIIAPTLYYLAQAEDVTEKKLKIVIKEKSRVKWP